MSLVWSHANQTSNARQLLQKGERLATRITAQLTEIANAPHSSVRSSDIQVLSIFLPDGWNTLSVSDGYVQCSG